MQSKQWSLKSGLALHTLDWGGEGPLVLAHHGTGFCAGTFARVAEELAGRVRFVALDARGHGDSDKPADGYSWPAFVADLTEFAPLLARSLGRERVDVGVGHSFGGAVTFMAAQADPAAFGSLLLMEPILITRAAMQHAGHDPDDPGPMARAARRRRPVLASREQARQSLSMSPAFVDVVPQAVEDYLDHGYRELEDGRLQLKCPPDIEADVFSMGPVDPALRAEPVALPTVLQRGSNGWFPAQLYDAFAPLMPNARREDVPAGHLIPMEIPERTAATILELAGG